MLNILSGFIGLVTLVLMIPAFIPLLGALNWLLVPMALFRTEEEVIEAGNDTEFGLASYVFTADAERAQRVAAGLRFGHVGWNTGTGPTPEAPFGGMKASGIGREGGLEGLFEFVEAQTVPRGF